jgi:hypothetical protein
MMRALLGIGATLIASVSASAAGRLDFGAWCSQVVRFDADRCLEGRAEDRLAYGTYLANTQTYENEMIRKQDSQRIESDRVNRMGDVTPDQSPVEGAADPR